MSNDRMQWSGYTDFAKTHQDKLQWGKVIVQFATEKNMNPIDLTTEKLIEFWVLQANLKPAMMAVVDKIIEFYWVKLRELEKWTDIVERYWVKPNHLDTILQHSDIWVAYRNFKRQYTWEEADHSDWSIHSNDISDEDIPTSQAHVDQDLWEEKILKQMKTTERENLLKLIETEQDKEKIKLYNAQLTVLDLELKTNG